VEAEGRPAGIGRLLLSSATLGDSIDITQGTGEFRGGAGPAATPRTLEVLGAAVPLPDATADDFGRVDTAERLRTPEAWQEWLGLPTGGTAWAGDRQVPETNFMARAEPGETTNGYVKTGRLRDGCPVWEKVT